MNEKVDDPTHPAHYRQHPSNIEPIDLCEYMTFNSGNALKYVWRAGLKSKDPLEDLRKAQWYLRRELNPPRRSVLDWLLQWIPRQTVWPLEFELLRDKVIASDPNGLVSEFLIAIGDGGAARVSMALSVVDAQLARSPTISP